MILRRVLLAGTLIVSPTAFMRAAGGLSGGVDCGVSDLWVTSPGVVRYEDGFGFIDYSVVLKGDHAITDTTAGVGPTWPYSVVGQYQQQVAVQGSYSRCYRASLGANAYRTVVLVESQGYGSSVACTQGPAPPPPGVPITYPGDGDPYSPCQYSPVLLDLDQNGFHLAGPADAVTFDMVPGGAPERMSWTRVGELDAFLALDRNGNGVVDDGSELFGNYTPLQNGQKVPYGFVPLAEFDGAQLGGNGNWIIDSGDGVFTSLRLWIDANHNGVSEPDELSTLVDWGLSRLEVDYSVSWKRDQYGNLFRSQSRAWRLNGGGQESLIQVYDVFFVPID